MKYALVTGASRGIGRSTAKALAEEGYYILINYLSDEKSASETLRIVREAGSEGELLRFDVSNTEQVDEMLMAWEKNHPDEYISVLVNNAGIRRDALMVFMQNEQWNEIIHVHLDGFFNVTRRVLKNMLTKRYGRIVNVVSLSGIKGLAGQTNYSAAKAGIIGAGKALAQEVAARKVTVNAVAPGFISTDMTQDLNEEQHKSLIPMQRFGKAEEVADLIAFLCSPKASYITGEVISINGGLYT